MGRREAQCTGSQLPAPLNRKSLLLAGLYVCALCEKAFEDTVPQLTQILKKPNAFYDL